MEIILQIAYLNDFTIISAVDEDREKYKGDNLEDLVEIIDVDTEEKRIYCFS